MGQSHPRRQHQAGVTHAGYDLPFREVRLFRLQTPRWEHALIQKKPKGNYSVKNIEVVAKGVDVQARIFTLAPGEAIPWHRHSESTDHYFVLRGTLTINTRKPDDAHILEIGSRYKIMPWTAHLISNRGATDCLFLLVQGVGKYDFIKSEN
jgi:quercetin dioxygenase-like cupin family protein